MPHIMIDASSVFHARLLINKIVSITHVYNIMATHFQVVKVRPSDKDAKAKYTECNKIVMMNAFAKAIAVNDNKSVAEMLDLENMSECNVYINYLLNYLRTMKISWRIEMSYGRGHI